MMKIAVLSGKGGTGKTFVSVNLAKAAQRACGEATYMDCDVEEPNGRLFLKPTDVEQRTIGVPLPTFDETLCNGCRTCVSFCKFHALVYIRNAPMVFPEVCHGCGGCALVCPQKAVKEISRPVGVVEQGQHQGLGVVTGELHPGEASGVPVISGVLKAGQGAAVVIDCPPGSSCAVMESVSQADGCVLVAEPTAFGFHNFKMVHQLVTLLGKPIYVVVNKADGRYAPLETFCQDTHTPILERIAYDAQLGAWGAQGLVAYDQDTVWASRFDRLWDTLTQEVTP